MRRRSLQRNQPAFCLALSLACGVLACAPNTAKAPQVEAKQAATPAPMASRLTPPPDWNAGVWMPLLPPLSIIARDEEREKRLAEATKWINAIGEPRMSADADVNPNFVHDLWAIAQLYAHAPRVNDRVGWAIPSCVGPRPRSDRGGISEAKASEDHGGKLYYLWARDASNYSLERYMGQIHQPDASDPIATNQYVVKQAFYPHAISSDDATFAERAQREGTYHFSEEEKARLHSALGSQSPAASPIAFDDRGRAYRAGESYGLFILFRPEHHKDQTDQGWVYGTLNASGEITACGLIDSCKTCHEEAPRERLFGIDGDLFGKSQR